MGSFAEVLSEATRLAVDEARAAASPFADAVRAFEDRVATASHVTVSGPATTESRGGARVAARYAVVRASSSQGRSAR